MAEDDWRASAGTFVGCWGYCLLMQVAFQDDGPFSRDPKAAHRGTEPVKRDVHNAPAVVQQQRKAKGEVMLSWVKTLVRIWRGELLEEERRRSKETVDEVRESLKCTKAMLDGEDSWLVPPGRRSCDGKQNGS